MVSVLLVGLLFGVGVGLGLGWVVSILRQPAGVLEAQGFSPTRGFPWAGLVLSTSLGTL